MGKIADLKNKIAEIEAALEAEKNAAIMNLGYLFCAGKSATGDESEAIKILADQIFADLDDAKIPTDLSKKIGRKVKEMNKQKEVVK